MTVSQGILPFKIELTERRADVTSRAGLPLVLEALRALFRIDFYRELGGALGYNDPGTVRRHLESIVLLVVAGGDCLDDLHSLRADEGICALFGFTPSSPTQAKDFLYRFHQAEDGRLLTDADDDRLSVKGEANIRPEGPGLRALLPFLLRPVREVHEHAPRSRMTLDADATIIEAHKARALKSYEGEPGYQPQMGWWVERGMWLYDEFRDGNVPAAYAVRGFLQKLFAQVDFDVEYFFRGDSAFYDEAGLTWLDQQGIGFAVTADLTEALADKVRAVPEQDWKPYRSLDEDGQEFDDPFEERQYSEIRDFIPNWARNYKEGTKPLRYIAIRVRPRQMDLLEPERPRFKHFAVVSNLAWRADKVLRWHRKKQGGCEHGHDIVKNELGGGTLPCGRFGANAAWWRLNAIAHNVLQFLKWTVLPESLKKARPKLLRFRLFDVAGRLIRHGGSLILKLSRALPAAAWLVSARKTLHELFPQARASSSPA